MKIAIFGTGYVGLVTGTCFAEMGNDVWCVDIDKQKIEALQNGNVPIYEPGLDEMIKNNLSIGTLRFTVDAEEALGNTNFVFIAVGTPMDTNGGADLRYVLDVARTIGRKMKRHMFVVDKSTVPVGTANRVREIIRQELEKRESQLTFDVISNPEFLKEGNALSDCLKPDRVVIGTDNQEAADAMVNLYRQFVKNTENFILMDIASAEMTKYAANAMLATKISFMNEISNICESVGANVNKVRRGIGSDTRIGYSFIYPGCGYGGSCFPKDIQALIQASNEHGHQTRLLKAVEDVNQQQKHIILKKIQNRFGEDLSGFCFAIWGLSFKPETDDMRESAAIAIINDITDAGATVIAYDPKAMDRAKKYFLKDNKHIHYVISKYDAVKKADALVLITEWKEFRSPDFDEIKKQLKNPIIFDGRNQYDEHAMKKNGFEYYQIGVGR